MIQTPRWRAEDAVPSITVMYFLFHFKRLLKSTNEPLLGLTRLSQPVQTPNCIPQLRPFKFLVSQLELIEKYFNSTCGMNRGYLNCSLPRTTGNYSLFGFSKQSLKCCWRHFMYMKIPLLLSTRSVNIPHLNFPVTPTAACIFLSSLISLIMSADHC